MLHVIKRSQKTFLIAFLLVCDHEMWWIQKAFTFYPHWLSASPAWTDFCEQEVHVQEVCILSMFFFFFKILSGWPASSVADFDIQVVQIIPAILWAYSYTAYGRLLQWTESYSLGQRKRILSHCILVLPSTLLSERITAMSVPVTYGKELNYI